MVSDREHGEQSTNVRVEQYVCVCTTYASTRVGHGCPALRTGDGGLKIFFWLANSPHTSNVTDSRVKSITHSTVLK